MTELRFSDTSDIGNIAFSTRAMTEDVAYIGRFDAELAKWKRKAVAGSDIEVTKLAIILFLARHAKRFS